MDADGLKRKISAIIYCADLITIFVSDIVDELWKEEETREMFNGDKKRCSKYVSDDIIEILESREKDNVGLMS